MESQWLRAVDCPLLQAEGEADSANLRLIQRLLEIAILHLSGDELPAALLEEIATALRADQAAIWEASPEWALSAQFARRGVRAMADGPAAA